MRKFLGLFVFWNFLVAASLGYAEYKKFDVYTDGNSPSNHYAPSGWMGDVGDLSLDDKNMEDSAMTTY